ncbi:MAG: type II toxin-antitoxin system HicB family antitoxin [Acidobacteriota bacterium]|nr:MAG: type II toxin-antitoxin system HicB family antitoxin [Acidobacteriota bacterium]
MESGMTTVRYVYWQDGEFWLGYFEEFPEYLTQALSLTELEENLRELYRDLTSGAIPCIRRLGHLQVA